MNRISPIDQLAIDEVARSINAAIGRLLDAPVAASIIVGGGGPTVLASTETIEPSAADEFLRRLGDGTVVLRIDDVLAEPGAFADVATMLGIRSLVLAPLRAGAEVAGALLAGHPQPCYFTDAHVGIIAELAEQASRQLDYDRLLEMERTDRRRAQALLEVAQVVTRSTELDAALMEICRSAASFSVAHRCAIFLTDGTDRPTPATGWDQGLGPQFERLEHFRKFQARLLKEERAASMAAIGDLMAALPLVLNDATNGPPVVAPWVDEFDVKSLAIYPMPTRSGMVGLMTLTAHDAPVQFPPDEVEAMGAIALQAAAVIEHLTLLEQVREHAERDGLTGLYNRRYLMKALEQELRAAKKSGRPLAAALLDLDGLKRLNDSRGHAAGDALLQRVAAALTTTRRAADTIARYGGDEFLMVMPETDLTTAIALSERLLQLISAGDPAAAASIGIATAPADATTASELLDAADAAMYAAKRSGAGIICYGRERSTANN